MNLLLAVLLAISTSVGGCRRSPSTEGRSAPDASRPLEHREEGLRFWVPSDEAEAVREVLRSEPLLLGVGELHQKTGSARVASAVKRFAGALLTELGPRTSDLIVETWMTEGRCGEEEQRVTREVEVTTQRPASTEDEVVTLLRRAKGLGVQPHILTVSCRDYQQLLGGGKEVDYEKLLGLVTRQLEAKAARVLQARRSTRRDAGLPRRRAIILYGGALHNDRFPPHEELRPFSYARALERLSAGRYVELDLYVPEYIAGDAELAKQRWFPIFRRRASPDRLLLIERGERSFILVFRRARPAP